MNNYNNREQLIINPQINTQYLNLGFESAETSTLVEKIRIMTPSGYNALNDAILQSSFLIQDVAKTKSIIEPHKPYQFVHIIIAANDDNKSRATNEEACGSMHYLHNTYGQSIRTHIVGLDMLGNFKSMEELNKLKSAGGSNCELLTITEMDIDSVFELLRQTFVSMRPYETNLGNSYVNINSQANCNYVVLFTLDYSVYMCGLKCQKVLIGIDRIIRSLGREDLVASVLFNDRVINVTSNSAINMPKSPLPNPSIQPNFDLQHSAIPCNAQPVYIQNQPSVTVVHSVQQQPLLNPQPQPVTVHVVPSYVGYNWRNSYLVRIGVPVIFIILSVLIYFLFFRRF
jgi:hypothetical protein